jgi:hypothetical protein
MDEPSNSELSRHLEQLEERITRERQEVLTEIRVGFDDVQSAIREQNASGVSRQVYEADQRRLDVELTQLRAEVGAVRRLLVFSFLSVIAVATLLQLLR